MKKLKKKVLLLCMTGTLLFSGSPYREVLAAEPINLMVNGNNITALSSPILENDRTLVPIRFISEELGAKVYWDGVERTVLVEDGTNSISLKIGSQLVAYDNGTDYEISDVAPKIINDRTYVPLRLVSNALDIGIDWDESSRTVIIDSNIQPEDINFFNVKLLSHEDGQVINGRTNLQIGASGEYMADGNEVRFLLLDPSTSKGFIIARGNDINGNYTYLPKIKDKGDKILVGAIYDKNGKFVAGDSVAVSVNVQPSVSLKGIYNGQVITGTASIGADINFFPRYIKYEITNLDTGNVTLTDIQDPLGTYNWSPMIKENGNYSIRVIAYENDDIKYSSSPVNIQVAVERSLALGGVTEGSTINKAVTLIAKRNFDVSETQYLMKDVNTGEIKTLATMPYGGYSWYPGPEDSGLKELIVRVTAAGVVYDSEPIRVKVDGSPKLLLEGIGPKQVLTGEVKLKASSNVKVDSVQYTLINSKTGAKKVLASNLAMPAEFTYNPAGQNGDWKIQVEGSYKGTKISSEQIQFKVYLGQTHGPKPIIEKSKYLGFASNLARKSYEKTGMSAALQTAQSILETGWGQSVPVDKYTGQISNNLFGIKGVGSAGSVTSNTWEVYNGVTYRVDAEFRAYNEPGESWADHKEFLNKDRYAGFRDVMFDYSQGAWALKRAGYATDPEYPIKLMKLIEQYNLEEIDKVGL
ncbi:glucosaminidase domain-containing protein [Tissierella sp. Yu-01]|uniref:stalk domain-containing protein n=1 Tax=Tissierella sp. Yu-01 TaxID=3035694 RepID=UPI00240D2A25|nr:glucosaminidase domain-containing protein [Tissierella sp. Yu-01]WFA08865.1 stalk domain-containing protein [Tissierella sp. Yu-01]